MKQSVIDLWHDLGSITTPVLLVPVGTALLRRGRLDPRWTLAGMIAPFVVTLAWTAAKGASTPHGAGKYPWSIEPIYAGLAASLAVYGAGWTTRLARGAEAGTASPRIEEQWMRRPWPWRRMTGTTRRVRSCQPKKLASNCSRSASTGRSSTAPGCA